jgi:tripeptidyl-peptidase I
MALHCILSLLALSWSTFAFPTSENAARRSGTLKTSIFEKLNGPPAGWIKDEAANIDKDASMIRLRIHLVQRNMGTFHELAAKVLRTVSLGLKDV